MNLNAVTPGLPAPGAFLSLRVSWVEVLPEYSLVYVWGCFNSGREKEYERLQSKIQSAKKFRFTEEDGSLPNLGDVCLVELTDGWQRGRIVGKVRKDFQVFLLDLGSTLTVGASRLAKACEDLFFLPPEVIACIIANLAPFCPGKEAKKWSPAAVEYFGHLRGSKMEGLVQDVIMPYRVSILEVPVLVRQMCEMGLAKEVPRDVFRTVVHRVYFPQYKNATPGLVTSPIQGSGSLNCRPLSEPSIPYGLDFFYPQLQMGVTEPVIVTRVSSPHRLFCQLKSLSGELKRLSEHMQHFYEGRQTIKEAGPIKLGSPCCARGKDGRWYRSVVMQIFSQKSFVEVLHVDYGTKEYVPQSFVKHLAADYFRMPVVTYVCALYGIAENENVWSVKQIEDLKLLLLHKSVSARIEYYCSLERVYYVTLYRDDGVNLNHMFGFQSSLFSDEIIGGCSEDDELDELQPFCLEETVFPFVEKSVSRNAESKPGPSVVPVQSQALKTAELKVNVFYDAVVEYAKNPSEFWIRTKEYMQEFKRMIHSIKMLYENATKREGLIKTPECGLFCCAKSKDSYYYRAVITSVQGRMVEVFFVDIGNTELVEWYDIKELLPKFQDLPCLAVKCCLADVIPLADKWSKEAVTYFRRMVLKKELVVHVLAIEENQYLLEMLDDSRVGEKSLSKVFSQAGYAKYQESDATVTPSLRPVLRKVPECLHVEQRSELNTKKAHLEHDHKLRAKQKQAIEHDRKLKAKQKPTIRSSRLKNAVKQSEETNSLPGPSLTAEGPSTNKHAHCVSPKKESAVKLVCPYKEQSIEVGCTVDVHVSYVDCPGNFWCQQKFVKNVFDLKTLMESIQAYCKNSATPYKIGEPACLARYSEDGNWYRALIVGDAFATGEVDILYVDYGNEEKVSVKDLLAIKPEFLSLQAQAFRCSVYNRILSVSCDPLNWNEDSVVVFQNFVDAAATDHIDLSCTIYGQIAVLERRFYVVDLNTPFKSVSQLLIEAGLASSGLQKSVGQAVQLYTFYYSTHDIKIGSEEVVYVTHVKHLQHFYCQLSRNSADIDDLFVKSSQYCRNKQRLNSLNPGSLYLAEYSDHNWYRCTVKRKQPVLEVFFVDYGNTYVVENKHLLPICSDEYKLMFMPMQAIKCGLSDVPVTVSEEINAWFEKTVNDKPLRAVVVAKESDGKLLVELYDGSVQLNAAIKERLGKQTVSTNESVSKCNSATETVERKCVSFGLSEIHCKTSRSEKKSCTVEERSKREVIKSLESSEELILNGACCVVDGLKEGSEKDGHLITETLSKLCDLPIKNLNPGSKAKVYLSHTDHPLSFFVQLLQDENELLFLADNLNASVSKRTNLPGHLCKVGNLVCGEFPDDSFLYRAIIKEKYSDSFVSVQFIDYGNEAKIEMSKVYKLDGSFLSIPQLAVHCRLAGVQNPHISNCWPEGSLTCFEERVKDNRLTCIFWQKSDGLWEVELVDDKGSINTAVNDVLCSAQNNLSQTGVENLASKESVVYKMSAVDKHDQDVGTDKFIWKIPTEGDTIETVAASVSRPDYFWCQFATAEEIQLLTKKLQDLGSLHVNGNAPYAFSVCDACIVKCAEDDQWYRAVIKGLKEDSLSVRFIDYGNEEVVIQDQICPIPSEILSIPVQAFPCCLEGFSPDKGFWDPIAADKFCEIVTKDDVLKVTVVRTGKDEQTCEIPMLYVNVECRGEVLSNLMQDFWRPLAQKENLSLQDVCSENKEIEMHLPFLGEKVRIANTSGTKGAFEIVEERILPDGLFLHRVPLRYGNFSAAQLAVPKTNSDGAVQNMGAVAVETPATLVNNQSVNVVDIQHIEVCTVNKMPDVQSPEIPNLEAVLAQGAGKDALVSPEGANDFLEDKDADDFHDDADESGEELWNLQMDYELDAQADHSDLYQEVFRDCKMDDSSLQSCDTTFSNILVLEEDESEELVHKERVSFEEPNEVSAEETVIGKAGPGESEDSTPFALSSFPPNNWSDAQNLAITVESEKGSDATACFEELDALEVLEPGDDVESLTLDKESFAVPCHEEMDELGNALQFEVASGVVPLTSEESDAAALDKKLTAHEGTLELGNDLDSLTLNEGSTDASCAEGTVEMEKITASEMLKNPDSLSDNICESFVAPCHEEMGELENVPESDFASSEAAFTSEGPVIAVFETTMAFKDTLDCGTNLESPTLNEGLAAATCTGTIVELEKITVSETVWIPDSLSHDTCGLAAATCTETIVELEKIAASETVWIPDSLSHDTCESFAAPCHEEMSGLENMSAFEVAAEVVTVSSEGLAAATCTETVVELEKIAVSETVWIPDSLSHDTCESFAASCHEQMSGLENMPEFEVAAEVDTVSSEETGNVFSSTMEQTTSPMVSPPSSYKKLSKQP
ncbi:tudor domain-containing protein 6, partial [Protopterus annectens]|uniref:tudor domain-containing protein 6 n=1 Tax=Protopterus annectens TaxID=7888 RepID=UPI001CFBDC02